MQEDTRKGPWTDQEDFLLANIVGLFGDRRWDFLAKVSGSKVEGDKCSRTGKSCRLRWVNYLHPGLKKGRMTSAEETLVTELHAKWGNRWSRIARRLPGRTDNEIKNYWRTYTRKKAQERKLVNVHSTTTYSEASSSSSNNIKDTFYSTGGVPAVRLTEKRQSQEESEQLNMDEIWKDIDLSKDTITPLNDGYNKGSSSYSYEPLVAPIWEYSTESLWKIDTEYTKMPPPSNNNFQAY